MVLFPVRVGMPSSLVRLLPILLTDDQASGNHLFESYHVLY